MGTPFLVQGLGAVLICALVAVWPGAAQERESDAFAERISVELVQVEVWVTDREGRYVADLPMSDFVVLHDGEEVIIEHFAEIGASPEPTSDGGPDAPARSESELAAPIDPGPRSGHLVVYFDELNLHAGNRKILVDELESFLDVAEVAPGNVLILRQGRALRVEAPFGSTGTELREALRRISTSGGEGTALATDADQALEEIRSLWRSSRDTAGAAATGIAGVPQGAPITTVPGSGDTSTPSGAVGGGGAGGLAPGPCEIFLGRVRPLLSNYHRQRAAQVGVTLERLSEAVTFLSGLSGVKTLLYLSDRLETAPAAGLVSYAMGFCPTDQQNLLMNAQLEDMSQSFDALARHASANRVTIYGVQARGLRLRDGGSASRSGAEFRGGGGFESAARANQQGGLLALARESGGRAILNTNDFVTAFRAIERDASRYYSLAYRPPPAGGPGFHSIEVRVNREGLRARHRRGYRRKSADERLAERVLGALNLGITDNPLGLRLGAGSARAGAESDLVVPLRVRIPIDRVTFSAEDDGTRAELRLKVNAHDTARGRLVNEDRLFRLTLPPGETGEVVDLGVDLSLAPGMHAIAVGVRDNASGVTSFVSSSIEVEEPGG